MKKLLFFLCGLFFCLASNAQDITLSNNSASNMSFRVFAYGANTGYNTCASLLNTYVNVAPGFIATISDFTTNVWEDDGGNVVNTSPYGAPVWTDTQFAFTCSSPPGAVKRILGNGLCNSSNTTGSVCGVTGTWSQSGSTVTVSVN